MKALVFSTEADAAKFADKLALDAGMPWVGGTEVGGGKHVDPAECVTLRVTEAVEAADAKSAAVLLEAETADALTKDDAPTALGIAEVTTKATSDIGDKGGWEWDKTSAVVLADAVAIDVFPVNEEVVKP